MTSVAADQVGFAAPVFVTNNGSSMTQLLIAVASATPLKTLDTMEGADAEDFFASLKAEMQGIDASFAMQAFVVVE
jgi:hypothetical protein